MALGDNINKDKLFPDGDKKSSRISLNESCLALLQGSRDGVFLTDDRDRVVFFSNSAERIWGYTAKEVKGKAVTMLFSGASKDSFTEHLGQRAADRVPTKEFFTIMAKDGSETKVRVSTGKVPVKGTFVISVYCNPVQNWQLSDDSNAQQQIEELRATEEELRQSNEELMMTQEELARRESELSAQLNAVDNAFAFIEFDPEGHIENANMQFLSLVGHKLSELAGRHHRMLIFEEDYLKGEYEQFWEDLRAGKPRAGEFRRKNKNGEELFIFGSYSPVLASDGSVRKIIKVARDITAEKLKDRKHRLELNEQISELQTSEEELRQTNEELQVTQNELSRRENEMIAQMKAIDNAMGFVEFSPEGIIKNANKCFLDMMGYTFDEVRGHHHQIFVDTEEARSEEYKRFWDALRRGIYTSKEFERIDKAGNRKYLVGSYSPVLDNAGKVIKVIKVISDITAAREREKEFEMLSLVTNNTDNSVIITDARGMIEFVNPGFTKLTGFTLEDSLGKKPGDFLQGPDTDPETVKRIRQKLDADEPFYEEILNYSKTGESYWISLAINPVFDAEGKLYRYISVQANVSDTKNSALDFTAKMKAIYETGCAAEFNLEGTFTEVSDAYCRVLGYTSEELIGQDRSFIVTEDLTQSDEFTEVWQKVLSGEAYKGSFERISKSGKSIFLEGSINPVTNFRGEIYKVISFFQDVSAKVRLERKLAKQIREFEANEQVLRKQTQKLSRIQTGMREKQAELEKLRDELEVRVETRTEELSNFQRDFTRMTSAVPGMIYLYREYNDGSASFPFTSDGIRDLFGKEPGDFEDAQAFREMIHAADIDSFYESVEDAVSNQKLWKWEGRFIMDDGSEKWLAGTSRPYQDEEGLIFSGIFTDITKNKETESRLHLQSQKLKEQEEGLRKNMEELVETQEEIEKSNEELSEVLVAINNSSAVLELDMEGVISAANERFLSLVNKTSAKVLGLHHSDFCDPETIQSDSYKMLWQALKEGDAQARELRHSIDGKTYWFYETFTPMKNVSGRYYKILCFIVDITAQRQRQEELRELKENLENEVKVRTNELQAREAELSGQLKAIDMAYGFVEFNRDGDVISSNEIFRQIVGISENKVLEMRFDELISLKSLRPEARAVFWSEIQNGKAQNGEFNTKAEDVNEERWLNISFTPTVNREGTVLKVLMLCTDITEQKKLNADFEGQLQSVDKSSAVVEFDLEGNIIKANENFAEIVGYSPSDLVGISHRRLCPPEIAQSDDYHNFWKKMRAGKFESGTFERVAKDGTPIFFQASYNPILGLDGKPYKVVKFATDVTDFTLSLKAASNFTAKLREGDFDAKIDLGKLKAEGDIAQMIQDNLSLRDTIKVILSEVNEVVRLAGQSGQLEQRLKIEGSIVGSWRDLMVSINDLLASISEPVLEINRILTALSQGDLTQEFNMTAEGDIREMADGLNTAIVNIRQLMRSIGQTSMNVGIASQQMLNKTEGMNNTTIEVSAAIQQMADGAQEQAAQTDESSKLVERILRTANQMGMKAEIINKSAENGQTTVKSGMDTILLMVKSMQQIAESADTTSASIEVLSNRSEEISRTLNVITDIAQQTNLLALNAAIEAARAGDAGRGFAVVADEIRKLAEDSRKSAIEIDRVIKDVRKDTESAGKAIDRMKQNVEDGNESTGKTQNVFQEIFDFNTATLELSREILGSANEQKNSIDTVVRNIEKIVVVSEETATGTQEVAGSAQNLSNSMRDIADTSKSLSDIADELNDQVASFTIDKNE